MSMISYYVFNSDSGNELFNSDSVMECRQFAKKYSAENCVPCTISVVFNEEHYINGQKLDV